VIKHRTRSALAICTQDMDGYPCGMYVLLMVTKSPLAAFEELIVMRCPWHLHTADGVIPEPSDIRTEGL
jgi:hypothetical protein